MVAILAALGGRAINAQREDPTRTARMWASMSADEHARSRLFERFKSHIKILELGRRVTHNTPVRIRPEVTEPVPTVKVALRSRTCGADAVFAGIATAAKALAIEDGTFLFTDYTIEVDRVFRGPAHVAAGVSVIVSRPGGAVRATEFSASAAVYSYPELALGQRYLFMVENAPGSAFHSGDPSALFWLNQEQAKALMPVRAREINFTTVGMPTNAFFNELSTVDCAGF